MVVDRQQRVDEGLLAYGLLELPVDGGLEPDEPHEGEHEEDAHDAPGPDQVLDRVDGAVRSEGQDGTSDLPWNGAPGPKACSSPLLATM